MQYLNNRRTPAVLVGVRENVYYLIRSCLVTVDFRTPWQGVLGVQPKISAAPRVLL